MRLLGRSPVIFGLAAAVLAGSVVGAAPGADAAPPAADTVLHGGYIYTVDRHDRVVSALAVRDGEIVYVGRDSGVRRYVGPRTRVIDLAGRMVMPGLHDGHIHGITVGNPTCDLEYQPLTVEEFQARITTCLGDPQYGAEPDDWLPVRGWYLQFMRPRGIQPTKALLDGLDTERPIAVSSTDGHSTLANSTALRLAGITRDTPDPEGGVIERDADGEPTGLLQDSAQGLVRRAMPPPPEIDPVEAARGGMERFSQEGITSFFVPGTGAETVETFQRLRDAGGLTARAHFALSVSAEDAARPQQTAERLAQLRAGLERPDEFPRSVRKWRPGPQRGPRLVAEPGVSVDAAKLYLDGVLQYPAQTAAVLEPYLVNTGTEDDPNWVPGQRRGQLYVDNPTLARLIGELQRRGFQAHVHAIGDRSVRTVLDGVAATRKAGRRFDSRPSIAHAELVDPADVDRFARLGVIPVMSYQWAKPGPDSTDTVQPYLGPDRYRYYEPEGWLADAGARIAFGSDYPVDPFDEWFNLEVGVLRSADWGPEFPEYEGTLNDAPGLSLSEAIRGITINAAYQMHQEKVTGSLEKGKLADLIVLDQNLFQIPPDDISETDVLMTMVGGKVVHTDPGF